MRVNGEQLAPIVFQPFEYLGPLILFGIDIESTLSADAVRWSFEESEPGVCFRKDGIWHGSVWRQAFLWVRVLGDDEQLLFLNDPLVMFRLKTGELRSPERRIGNIAVVVPAETELLLELGRISMGELNSTVNDRHHGILIPGNPFLMCAVHWFSRGPVLVMGTVSQSRQEGERLKIEQVTCVLALRLRNSLPAGTIDEWMNCAQILEAVAESFGVPLVCSKNGSPAKFHVEADWDGHVEIREVDESFGILIVGVFIPAENRCRCVWAFSVEKYRRWLPRPTRSLC
jgi:hypothetical protein